MYCIVLYCIVLYCIVCIVCVVSVSSDSPFSHGGITLQAEGTIALQLSARSVGLFEAFYSSLKPVQLLQYNMEITPSGKLPQGTTEFPFEFVLKPFSDKTLFETYHGVYVNIQYQITASMGRSMLAKDVKKTLEFMVEIPQDDMTGKGNPMNFSVSPSTLQNVRKVDKC